MNAREKMVAGFALFLLGGVALPFWLGSLGLGSAWTGPIVLGSSAVALAGLHVVGLAIGIREGTRRDD